MNRSNEWYDKKYNPEYKFKYQDGAAISNADFTKEMSTIMENITDTDKRILEYLLDTTLSNFYKNEYDQNYKLPYIRD